MIRVAGYCRVSTDKEDQANSFVTQQQYFRDHIAREPEWVLYDIYADEGLSGTGTKKRAQFNRMINDAYAGKFQLIITKEVSRFSRNILDTIAYTRELKSIGVGVFFLTDRINTLDPEAEMLLAFLASLAQEESRRTSGRVVWGQTRQMEKGIVFGRSPLGYSVKDGKISVEPEGAQIVRLIFQQYTAEQMSPTQIARFLTREGYRTSRGSSKWQSSSVIKILHNEKYVGDLIQKKTYTPDFLTHEKRRNTGQVPLVSIRDHHEPLVSREIWDAAQARLQANHKHIAGMTGLSNRYAFSGKIKCGECGACFVGRIRYRKDGGGVRRWSCATSTKEGVGRCSVGRLVRDDDAAQMLRTAMRALRMDRKSVIDNVVSLAVDAILAGEQRGSDAPEQLRLTISQIQRKRETMMDSYFSREITLADMQALKQRYDEQLATLRRRLAHTEDRQTHHRDVQTIRDNIEREVSDVLNGVQESDILAKTIVHSLTVFKDRHLELKLYHLPHIFHFFG